MNDLRWIAAAALIAGAAPVRDASACGGLFCNNTNPNQIVVQSGESIIFAVDRPAETVTAIINIRYRGAARDFAWILPLQSAPSELGVAPTGVFTAIDRLTAPRFEVTTENRGVCVDVDISFGSADEAAARSPEDPGVTVLQRSAVGPYESAVIEGNDPNAVRTWLTEAGYVVTDEMMQVVVPYLSNGDVLLALRLQKDRDTGDIQPIRVTMEGNEVCVPIRLTAIAAQEDMDITTLVLSADGRAVPENYFHVGLNLAKIDWTSAGSNYRQVVAAAADEGTGNAFTTEFAGSARIFDNQIDRWNDQHRDLLAGKTNAAELVLELDRLGLFDHTEVSSIVSRAILDAPGHTLTAQELVDPRFVTFRLNNVTLDSAMVVMEIWERVVRPAEATQQLFDRFNYATRLYTLISPKEMNVDPTFQFRTDLPDVNNVHRAKAIIDCGLGRERNEAEVTIVIEETGQELVLSNRGITPEQQRALDRMPASTHVEQLFKGELVRDNREAIDSALKKLNGCGCNATAARGGFAPLLFALLLVLRRRR